MRVYNNANIHITYYKKRVYLIMSMSFLYTQWARTRFFFYFLLLFFASMYDFMLGSSCVLRHYLQQSRKNNAYVNKLQSVLYFKEIYRRCRRSDAKNIRKKKQNVRMYRNGRDESVWWGCFEDFLYLSTVTENKLIKQVFYSRNFTY